MFPGWRAFAGCGANATRRKQQARSAFFLVVISLSCVGPILPQRYGASSNYKMMIATT
jgi:hypothetical protein